jgi:hypothetical protein
MSCSDLEMDGTARLSLVASLHEVVPTPGRAEERGDGLGGEGFPAFPTRGPIAAAEGSERQRTDQERAKE